MTYNAVIVGWRNYAGRAEVRERVGGRRLGFVRLAENRWFAESETAFPLEGTYKTRQDAVAVVVASAP